MHGSRLLHKFQLEEALPVPKITLPSIIRIVLKWHMETGTKEVLNVGNAKLRAVVLQQHLLMMKTHRLIESIFPVIK